VRRALEAVLATGKRRIALLGLAFKTGTDDLRESPLLALAARLAAEDLEVRIHDPVVHLATLQGANRAYLEARLPEVSHLLCERLDEALDGAEVVVIGHDAPPYGRDDEWRGQGKVVVRLE
jgi:GDP-mannose 6-dehydrogenase